MYFVYKIYFSLFRALKNNVSRVKPLRSFNPFRSWFNNSSVLEQNSFLQTSLRIKVLIKRRHGVLQKKQGYPVQLTRCSGGDLHPSVFGIANVYSLHEMKFTLGIPCLKVK